jgi:hypothetical protein
MAKSIHTYFKRVRKKRVSKKIKISKIRGETGEDWIIHEPRLLQMRGVIHAAVVFYRKWVTTKQMQ